MKKGKGKKKEKADKAIGKKGKGKKGRKKKFRWRIEPRFTKVTVSSGQRQRVGLAGPIRADCAV